jgi:hypothetical protein
MEIRSVSARRWRSDLPRLIPLPILVLLLVGCASDSSARKPRVINDCCADIGIDVTPVLGPKAVDCKFINTKPQDSATRSRNESAIACVQRAELRGRPYVVNQGFSIPPDFFVRYIVMSGAQGEKLLVRQEWEHDGPSYFVGQCTGIKLHSDGEFDLVGCVADDDVLKRLTPASASRPEN